jgi:hypothetical protein
MGAAAASVAPLTNSLGFNIKVVDITEVDIAQNRVMSVDRQQRTQLSMSLFLQRAKGRIPKVGEVWLADQTLGFWSLAAFVGSSLDQFEVIRDEWHDATYTANWSTYTATAGWGPAQYRISPDNLVNVRGMVVPASGGWVTNSVIFTLPVGYWPPVNANFRPSIQQTLTNPYDAQLSVFANGEVRLINPIAPGSGATRPGWVGLDVISFSTD